MTEFQRFLAERRRSAFATLSSLGAGIAGIGVGALLAAYVGGAAWLVLAVGLAVHLFGMIGTRRLLASGGYRPSRWGQAGYWLCWAGIAVLVAFVSLRLIAGS
jgi:hypothetical protein